MTKPNKVLVYAESYTARDIMCHALDTAGYTVVIPNTASPQLLATIETSQPDALVIQFDAHHTQQVSALETLQALQPIPIVVFGERGDVLTMEQLIRIDIAAYVSGNTELARVPEILQVACARFAHTRALHAELAETKAALASRKWVDQAKALLMEQRQLSEADAYNLIRKLAMDKGQKMEEMAKTIIEMSHLWLSVPQQSDR